MADLKEIRKRLESGSISLGQALVHFRDAARERLSIDDKAWLDSELGGYEVSEDLRSKVSGVCADAGDDFPAYRRLNAYKTIATNPKTGEVEDASWTTLHKLAHLEIQSIPTLENTVWKLISAEQPIGTRTIYKEVQFDKFINSSEYERLAESVRVKLLDLIAKYS